MRAGSLAYRVSTWRDRALIVAALGLFAALLAGCGSAATVSRPAATATPAPTAAPQVLYQVDFAHGGSAWKLPAGWKLTPDGLANSGHSTAPLMIPYTPTATNYTITITLKVNAVVGPNACGNEFGLEGWTPDGAKVYDAVIACIDQRYHGESELYCSNLDGGMGTWDYATSTGSRDYVINVAGQNVSYSPSGQDLGTSHCALPTSPAKLMLLNSGVDTIIQGVTITTP